MASTFITTTPRGTFNAMRFQGILVTDSYAQLASMLENSLAREHALFLAEPVHDASGESTDWYSKADAPPVRLDSLPDEERAEAMRTIARIASDIHTLAEELKTTGSGSKGIRGNILSLALRYPGPEHIYMAGGQPVLTCWGFEPGTAGAQPEDLMRLGSAFSAAPRPAQAALPPAPAATAAAVFPWWRALLCLLLGALLLAGLFFLAGLLFGPAGCAAPGTVPFAYPGCAPGALNATIPAQGNGTQPPTGNGTQPHTPEIDPLVSSLTAEQEKSRSLQRQLEDLRRRLNERARLCKPAEPAKPETAVPEEPPLLSDMLPSTPEPAEETPAPQPKPQEKPQPKKQARGEDLRIPEDAKKNNDVSFLDGCWDSDSGLVSLNTGEPIQVQYCFDTSGKGTRTVTRSKQQDRCVGPVRAKFDTSGKLRIDADGAACSKGGSFVPQQVECITNNGKTICYGREEGSLGNKWDARFRRR